MRRRTKNFGHFKLLAIFLFISVLIPKFLSVGATTNLGDFEEGEYGIKLCAVINEGQQDALRFHVTSDQGFESDVIVENDSCKTISPIAATYTVKEYLPQEYVLDSVAGGTVSADNTPFIITANSQAKVIYTNSYSKKNYLHTFGYTTTTIASTSGGGGQGGDEDPCESNILYRHIECLARQHNVIDSNVDFSANINVDDPTQMGVNTLAETKNDTYPVYYYRGSDVGQHVLWEDKCWTILRTTSTGGVKLEYESEAEDNNGTKTCQDAWDNSLYMDANGDYKYDDISFNLWDDTTYAQTPTTAGYMYGKTYVWDFIRIYSNQSFTFSNDVTYANGVHTLSGDKVTGYPTGDVQTAAEANHHYFCLDGSESCTNVAYLVEFNTDSPESYATISYLLLTDTADIETAKEDMFANVHDSNAKMIIDNWFEEYFADKISVFEDTQFCNDRNFFVGSYTSKDSQMNLYTAYDYQSFPNYGTSFFVGAKTYEEFMPDDYRPNVNCDNVRDSFTVSSSIGNGKLTYPVGMATSTERLLAGIGYTRSVYDPVNTYRATMTPLMASYTDWNSEGGGVYMDSGGSLSTAQGIATDSAVVSLKYGAVISGGDGSIANPYTLTVQP